MVRVDGSDGSMGGDLTVLVTDDDAGCRELYRHWLADHHEVRTASHGYETLEQLDESVDVVLLDRDMPGPSGSEVARRIAATDFDPHVAMISSAPFDLDLVETPIHDYRRKPVDESDIRAIIAEYRCREEYEAALAELFSLTSKLAALEAGRTSTARAVDERYARLEWLVEEKRVEVDRALRRSDPDWTTAFRTFGPPAGPDPPSRPV